MLSAYMALIDSKPLRKEFERFYNDNRRLGMSKAYEVLGNISMAEDALSEAFFRLAKCFQKVHNLPSHKLQSYFVIIVRNVSIDLLRRESRADVVEYADEHGYGQAPDELPDSDAAELARCIGLLGDTDREILYLRFELELDYDEIARALGITEDAARHRVHHARSRLRKLLEGECADE
ncbi:MAG: sigma-70 family RNA polymerase sigma factor [Ruminococcus sp.]|nr:sigma-70 family RNA polymerase sigma factor [Ruminococcus sp.]